MALTPQLAAELVRLRLGQKNSADAARIMLLIPEALKAFARKIAADSNLRNLLLTDPALTLLPLKIDNRVDLKLGFDRFNFLLEYLDYGQIYHKLSPLPMQPVSPLQGKLLGQYMASQFVNYYVESNSLVVNNVKPDPLLLVTVNPANDIFTANNHGLIKSQAISFAPSFGGTLPGGLVANQVYFVIYVDANTFTIANSFETSDLGFGMDITAAPGTGSIVLNPNAVSFAVPTFPKTLAQLPKSEEAEKMFIDKLIEMLPESGPDYAQDGEK